MKQTKEEIQKAISKFPGYCSFWSGSGLCSYPNPWRSNKRSNLNNCKIIPGKENKICNLSELDNNFIDTEL